MEKGYRIELARPENLAVLPAIERAAAEVFPEGMIPDEAKNYFLSLEDFKIALAQKTFGSQLLLIISVLALLWLLLMPVVNQLCWQN